MKTPEQILIFFGLNHQRRKAAEECAELICELMRFECERGSMEKLAEEMADVSIMIEQLSTLCKTEFETHKSAKYARISARIERAEWQK